MRYLGGKAKIAKRVSAVVNALRRPGQPVWEPFCGGLNSAATHGGVVLASDVREDLINLYRAIAAGWDPPGAVSEAEYAAAKRGDVAEPLRSFALYGCSFGGDRYGGYARGENYADITRRALLRDVPRVTGFVALDFLALEPRPLGWVIYCDPPYVGRRGYGGKEFDRDRFVSQLTSWSRGNTVLVSEYDLPVGEVVWAFDRVNTVRSVRTTRTERIYYVGS